MRSLPWLAHHIQTGSSQEKEKWKMTTPDDGEQATDLIDGTEVEWDAISGPTKPGWRQ